MSDCVVYARILLFFVSRERERIANSSSESQREEYISYFLDDDGSSGVDCWLASTVTAMRPIRIEASIAVIAIERLSLRNASSHLHFAAPIGATGLDSAASLFAASRSFHEMASSYWRVDLDSRERFENIRSKMSSAITTPPAKITLPSTTKMSLHDR